MIQNKPSLTPVVTVLDTCKQKQGGQQVFRLPAPAVGDLQLTQSYDAPNKRRRQQEEQIFASTKHMQRC
jgi:hypothetical protein